MIVRPVGSKIFRAYVSKEYDRKEVHDVLLLWSMGRYIDGVYYMRIDDMETMVDLLQTLDHMDIDSVLIEPDENTWGTMFSTAQSN